jgi:hypothetical protein
MEVVRCRERPGGLLKYYEREAAQKSKGQRATGSQLAHVIRDAGNVPKDLPGLIYHQRAQSNEFSLQAVTGTSFLTIRDWRNFAASHEA